MIKLSDTRIVFSFVLILCTMFLGCVSRNVDSKAASTAPWRSSLSEALQNVSGRAASPLQDIDLSDAIGGEIIGKSADVIVIDVTQYADFGKIERWSILITELNHTDKEYATSNMFSVSPRIQIVKVPKYVYETVGDYVTMINPHGNLTVNASSSTAPLGVTIRYRQNDSWKRFTVIGPQEILEGPGSFDAHEKKNYSNIAVVNAVMSVMGAYAPESHAYHAYQKLYVLSFASRKYENLFYAYSKLESCKEGLALRVLKEALKERYSKKDHPGFPAELFDTEPGH